MDKTELTKVLHKEYHKRFKTLMAEHSFKRYKSNDYLRVTSDNIAQMINIQKHSWDLRFTFNITVFPLFFESEFMYFAFGGIRVGYFKTGQDFWWKYSNESELNESLADAESLFRSRIFPFYDEINDAKKLLSHLNSGSSLFGPNETHKKDVEQLSYYVNAGSENKSSFDEITHKNSDQFGIDINKYALQ